MSQTQELPPWLSFSVTTVTDANGTPVATSSSLVYLPLTYFGPSIPLGSEWTFGGLTSPASTSTTTSNSATITSTTPSITTSASSVPSSTPSATPSTTASASSVSSSSSSTSSATPSASSHLSRNSLIGVIVGSILGLLFLFIISLVVFLMMSRWRKRKVDPQWAMVTPIDDDYYIVPPGGHSPGEGSPRHSGEEADPFLNRNIQMRHSSSGAPVSVAGAGVNDGSLSSSNKSSAASGYGTLLERPSLAVSTAPPEQRRGRILSPEELRRLDQESVLPLNTDFGPAVHPPRLVGSSSGLNPPLPVAGSRHSITPSIQSWELVNPAVTITHKPSQNSISASLQDEPTVVTARRVRMDSSAVSPPSSPAQGSSNQRSSWKAFGLGGLAGLARLSWFKNNDSTSSSRRASFLATGLTDNDIEVGRALLDEPSTSERSEPRPRRVQELATEERPISTFSTKSGLSVYHDAQSSIPGTPLLAPPPRALPSNIVDSEFGGWPGLPASHPAEPSETTTTTTTQAVDILDMPAPRGISPFASTSSLRDTSTTSSSINKKIYPHPPGLVSEDLPTPAAWKDTDGATPSPGSFAVDSPDGGNRLSTGITIDVLEEAPPAAGQSWRSLAGSHSGNKRTTFGLPHFMQTPDFASEQASLHSMRSHLSPVSSRSAGSAPASRRDGSGSQSSRRTGSSGPSLAHSNSLSSDGRKHGRRPEPRSPTLSAFGDSLASPKLPGALYPMLNRLPSDETEEVHSRATSNSYSHFPLSHSHGNLGVLPEGIAIDGASQGRAESEQPLSRAASPVLSATNVPWAIGLDTSWTVS